MPMALDVVQIHMLAAPENGHLNRAEHVFPAGMEGLGDLCPAHALCPRRQKPSIGLGEPTLAQTFRQDEQAEKERRRRRHRTRSAWNLGCGEALRVGARWWTMYVRER